MKKRLTFIFSLVLIFSCLFSVPVHATYNDEVEFESEIVYMESLDRGTVIFNKNSDKKTSEASLTKITTAMVVLDNCKDLDAVVTVSQKVMDTLAGTNSSTAGISVGEQLTVRQLLNLMLVKSANEAASILADYVGGDIDTFVGMMNDFAKELGCKNTHYTNPHGLDDEDHYSTAEDLAKIIKYALKNEIFCEIVSSPTYTLSATNKRDEVTYSNTNSMLQSNSMYYYEYCKGIKTGTTENAGKCLASYATKNGYTYLCIIMKAPEKDSNGDGYTENFAFKETKKAYEWAFNNIKLKVVAEPSDVVTVVDVDLAKKVDHLRLVPSEEATALVPAGVDPSAILIEPVADSIKKDIKAPIKAGTVLGKANVMYAGDVLYTIDLVAGEDVDRSFFAYIGYLIKKFFSSSVMKLVLAILGIALVFYIIVNILYSKKKKDRKIRVVHGYRNAQGLSTKNSKPSSNGAAKPRQSGSKTSSRSGKNGR